MSTPPLLSIPSKSRRKSLHRRTGSGELDVFEAERYFSTSSDDHLSQTTTTTITIPQRIGIMRSTNPRQGRASLDIPILNHQHQNHVEKEKKKHKKQPNSPGGKLVSFFNSLINQTVSKNKNKTLSKPIKSDVHANSIRSSSGFRTPPPYMIKKLSYSTSPNPNLDWLDEEFKFVTSSVKEVGNFEKRSEGGGGGNFKRFMEEDGDDSDSSSDLFELQLNYDNKHLHNKLGYCANGLPVYETTRMDTIKISCATPITNGPFRN